MRLPFAEPTSNNAIPLARSRTAFLMSVVVGAQHFAQSDSSVGFYPAVTSF